MPKPLTNLVHIKVVNLFKKNLPDDRVIKHRFKSGKLIIDIYQKSGTMPFVRYRLANVIFDEPENCLIVTYFYPLSRYDADEIKLLLNNATSYQHYENLK
jgi:hypothetical protein